MRRRLGRERVTKHYDNSITFIFDSEQDAKEVANDYNREEDYDNVAIAKSGVVVFLGQKFKRRAIEEFE